MNGGNKMSHTYEKIKYIESGAYGSTEEHTLYMDMNNCCDITTIYYEDGTPIFSFEDTLDDNIFEKMIELAHGNKDDNPNIENWNIDELNNFK